MKSNIFLTLLVSLILSNPLFSSDLKENNFSAVCGDYANSLNNKKVWEKYPEFLGNGNQFTDKQGRTYSSFTKEDSTHYIRIYNAKNSSLSEIYEELKAILNNNKAEVPIQEKIPNSNVTFTFDAIASIRNENQGKICYILPNSNTLWIYYKPSPKDLESVFVLQKEINGSQIYYYHPIDSNEIR